MRGLVDEVLAFADAVGLQSVSLRPQWAQHEVGEGERRMVLRSWAFAGGHNVALRWLRLTTIEGRGTRIFNWAAFSAPQTDGPLCQGELIDVKGRLFLLVLDAIDPLTPTSTPACVQALGRDLPPVERRPAWAQGFISDNAVWSRPQTPETLPPGFAALRGFLDLSHAWLRSMQEHPEHADKREDFYQAMRTQFLANEPSRPFMHRLFGESWSEPYMSEFLFPA